MSKEILKNFIIKQRELYQLEINMIKESLTVVLKKYPQVKSFYFYIHGELPEAELFEISHINGIGVDPRHLLGDIHLYPKDNWARAEATKALLVEMDMTEEGFKDLIKTIFELGELVGPNKKIMLREALKELLPDCKLFRRKIEIPFKVYETGELITKPSICDEPWFNAYSYLTRLMEKLRHKDKALVMFNERWKETKGEAYEDQDQLIRWADYLITRF